MTRNVGDKSTRRLANEARATELCLKYGWKKSIVLKMLKDEKMTNTEAVAAYDGAIASMRAADSASKPERAARVLRALWDQYAKADRDGDRQAAIAAIKIIVSIYGVEAPKQVELTAMPYDELVSETKAMLKEYLAQLDTDERRNLLTDGSGDPLLDQLMEREDVVDAEVIDEEPAEPASTSAAVFMARLTGVKSP